MNIMINLSGLPGLGFQVKLCVLMWYYKLKKKWLYFATVFGGFQHTFFVFSGIVARDGLAHGFVIP